MVYRDFYYEVETFKAYTKILTMITLAMGFYVLAILV